MPDCRPAPRGVATEPDEAAFIRQNRRRIENLNSQLEAMGIQHLYTRTIDGFHIKVHATLCAVTASFLN